jgi:flagellar biosynthesis protein FlhB
MNIEAIEPLARTLQASISPVAMISGVGLLILSFTNRFSRVTDLIRELSHHLHEAPANAERARAQLRIFIRRAALLRGAVSAAAGCVLLSAVIVLVIFLMAVLEWHLQVLVLSLFTLSLISLIAALLLFLQDMRLSLRAAREEIRDLEL